MQLRRLQATFGKLEGDTLVLSPGLNCIHAPNEAGKSTWCAFLRAMLYGLPAKARGPLADKNRYAPWSGRAMEGMLEAETDLGVITITRQTLRPNSPMGAFRAVYTGTAETVEALTAGDCGERLTGVPLGVFARSAFISQAAMPISQDAELERRIAALVTTGEEDASYTEGLERLKKQMNRLRYHKAGLLPQLEQEIAQLRAANDTAAALERQLESLRSQQASLRRRCQEAESQLARQRQSQLALAQKSLAAAEEQVLRLEAAVQALPSQESLLQLRAAIAALAGQSDTCEEARQRAKAARRQLETAEAALSALPPPRPSPEPHVSSGGVFSRAAPWLAALVLLAAGLLLSLRFSLAPALPAGILAGAAVLLFTARRRSARRARETAADPPADSERTRRAAAEEQVEAARAALRDAETAYEALAAALTGSEKRLIRQAQAFSPHVADLAGAEESADEALEQHRQLELARQEAERQRLRCAMLPPETAVFPEETVPAAGDVQSTLAADRAELEQLRAQEQYLLGRIQALQEEDTLSAALTEKEALRTRLQAEYDALSLAAEALSRANSQLQTRFSPALGENAAKLFAKLTKGRYNKVFLNREMDVSAGQRGSEMARDIPQLSQGTADQLYLAVRLAICDMVLPVEKQVPLILDDALAHFDDERMAAALDVLVERAQARQILLFSCHDRELRYLERAHPGAFHAVSLSPGGPAAS